MTSSEGFRREHYYVSMEEGRGFRDLFVYGYVMNNHC